jgi:hypothetical protein
MIVLITMYHCLCLFASFRSDDKMNSQRQMSTRNRLDFGTVLHYGRYYRHPRIEIISPHIFFGSLLAQLMQSSCVLTALCFLLSLPVYVLKQFDVESTGEIQYVTHTHMYNWLWTMAFVSGTTPAIILLMAGFVCLLYFDVVINRLGGTKEHSLKPVSGDQNSFGRITSVWAVFILNIAVVGTVNGLYIYSTLFDLPSDVRVWIQLSFALFSSLWSLVLRIGLPSQIKESRYGVWLFICLNVMNSVMIPCAVTALSTPSCYQVCLSMLFVTHSLSVSRDCLCLQMTFPLRTPTKFAP